MEKKFYICLKSDGHPVYYVDEGVEMFVIANATMEQLENNKWAKIHKHQWKEVDIKRVG